MMSFKFNNKKFSDDVLYHRNTVVKMSRKKYGKMVGTKGCNINNLENRFSIPSLNVVYNIVKYMGKTIDEYFDEQ